MQTERVTFLTTPEHKAALDAYAREHGKSVGHVLREVSTEWLAAPKQSEEERMGEAMLEALLPELERLVPKWNAQIDRMCETIDRARESIRESLERADKAMA
jgi:hypothetical protein